MTWTRIKGQRRRRSRRRFLQSSTSF